jgi:L-ascorbate metabolism protein UlaG (beta-lactamase superfamily)
MATVTFLGHSCVQIHGGGSTILIDPFLTGNPLAGAKANEIQCDFIVVTHAHGDHLGDAIDIARRTHATIISNFEIHNYCVAKGAKAHPLHIGGGHRFPFGRAKLTVAHHGSSFPDGSYGGTPAGVLLTLGGQTIYHAGDTALTYDMLFVGEAGVDLALLPIGDNFTMGADDAARALDLIKPRVVIPIHYNTFDVIAADPRAFASRAEQKGVTCVILKPGDSYELK